MCVWSVIFMADGGGGRARLTHKKVQSLIRKVLKFSPEELSNAQVTGVREHGIKLRKLAVEIGS